MAISMEDKKRVFAVLCIDGGGALGLIPARILQELEERTGLPISKQFHAVMGTSTGSIVAAVLGMPHPDDPTVPKYKAVDAVNFYHKHLPLIFSGSNLAKLSKYWKSNALYSPEPLYAAFDKAFGDARMKDLLINLRIPAVDIYNNRAIYLSSCKDQDDPSSEQWSSMSVKHAVSSACAAPVYFPAFPSHTNPDAKNPDHKAEHHLIDGGIFSGNVPHALYEEAKRLAEPDQEIVFVHLGTGKSAFSKTADAFNDTGPADRVKDMMSLFLSVALKDTLQNMEKELGNRFFSFDDFVPDTHMAENNPAMLKYIEECAEYIIKKNDAQINRLAEILKTHTISDDVLYENYSTNFHEILTELKSKNTAFGITQTYTSLQENDTYHQMAENERAEVEQIVLKMLTKHFKKGALNAALKFGDEFSRVFDKFIPSNDNIERPAAPIFPKSRLSRLFNGVGPFLKKLISGCTLSFNKNSQKQAKKMPTIAEKAAQEAVIKKPVPPAQARNAR